MANYLQCYDLSLNCTGYAIFDMDKRQNKHKLIHYGIINNNHMDKNDLGRKLLHLEMSLMTLKQAYPPSIIIKEELTGTGFGDSTKIARAHGIFEKVFIGSEYSEIHNGTFKKQFAGHGQAKKPEVQKAVREALKDEDFFFITDDVSDAIGFGIHYMKVNGIWR